MKVIVTGGCGFIGSHLVDTLILKGHEVSVIDNMCRGHYIWSKTNSSSPNLYNIDINDLENLEKAFNDFKPEMVFHMAAHHYIPFCENNPYETFSNNVSGTINVVNCSHKSGNVKKMFFASTGDVYAPSSYKHRETDQVSPIYIYGESKLIGENILRRYKSSLEVDFDIAIGRLFNAAGTRETNPHFLPMVVRQLEKGLKRVEVGNTWPVRDFVDVKSMANLIAELTDKCKDIDVYNIGSGQPQVVQDVLNMIAEGRSKDIEIVSVKSKMRKNDRGYLCPSVEKINQLIGHSCKPFDMETAREIWNESAETRILYKDKD
tara:strand:+ start:238 stop:1194 length:957 start_codon:yes stop_codon:yes gene_type:complete